MTHRPGNPPTRRLGTPILLAGAALLTAGAIAACGVATQAGNTAAPPPAPLPASTSPAIPSPASPSPDSATLTSTTALLITTPAVPATVSGYPDSTSQVAETTVVNTPTSEISPPPAESTTAAPRAQTQQAPTDLQPNTLSIPVLSQINVPIGVATESESGVLEPPADVDVVGAWAPGAPLDAASGTTNLVGHVNYTGQGDGALHDIAYLQTGDKVYTTDDAGQTIAWVITDVTARPKSTGVDVAAFTGLNGPRRLVLITCGGAYDASDKNYLDNVYAYATPA